MLLAARALSASALTTLYLQFETEAEAALGLPPGVRDKLVRELVEKIILDDKTIIIKRQRGALLGGDVPLTASADGCDNAIELTAAVAFMRRGAETKLVVPGLAQQKHLEM
jgi:hypothetical protein